MRAVIYTQRVEIVESYRERRDCADQRIADFISQCGFLPIPVPNKAELAAEIVSSINPVGIVLTGGNSLEKYGGDAPERDAMDKKLIDIAVKQSIPLYGFCRGMQSILDFFGNKIINVDGHVAVRHLVYEGAVQYEVNSYHNQACIELERNCGLKIISQAEDGVIEAVCHEYLPIIATMWHPEREKEFDEKDVNRVKELFNRRVK
ncbi:MAG: C26 family cysteine hydrolase domain-containing family [Lachnospiraceae bacterium]|nr:C26 family cysteine hydrolase domain-containing family [Lachnospiraceae bacterium]